MESRAFIRATATLISEMQQTNNVSRSLTADELQAARDTHQKEMNSLFSGLQNPSLPSAFRLRDFALENGYYVDPRVLQALSRMENIMV